MVPTLTCGLLRSNLALPIARSSARVRFRVTLTSLLVVRSSLFPGGFANDLFRHGLRHFLVMMELHRVGRPALRRAAERGRVPEHLRQWHLRGHDLRLTALVHRPDLATPAGEITDDRA